VEWIYFLLGSWLIVVVLHAFIRNEYVELTEKMLDAPKTEALAFDFWVGSLNKKGFPMKENGSHMNSWELYNYWNENVDKEPWINHVKRYWQ
jgi:hypothetical protein